MSEDVPTRRYWPLFEKCNEVKMGLGGGVDISSRAISIRPWWMKGC